MSRVELLDLKACVDVLHRQDLYANEARKQLYAVTKHLILEQNMSIAEASRLSGVSRATIYKVLREGN